MMKCEMYRLRNGVEIFKLFFALTETLVKIDCMFLE